MSRCVYRRLAVLAQLSCVRLRQEGKPNTVWNCNIRAFGGFRMQFHSKNWVLTLGLCMFSTCVLAHQSPKPSTAAAKPPANPAAQETKQSLFKAQHFDQAAISPDGKRVAWVEIRADEDGAPTGKQDTFVQDVSGAGKPIRV